MAEVSRRLGLRAFRISVLSSSKRNGTAGVEDVLAATGSSKHDSTEHEHCTGPTEPEVRNRPVKRGELPSLEDSKNTPVHRGTTEVYCSSDHEQAAAACSYSVSLPPLRLTGHDDVVFLDERGQSLEVCRKRQRSHKEFGYNHRPTPRRGSHSSIGAGSLLRATLNDRLHMPLHQLRSFHTAALQTDGLSRLFNSILIINNNNNNILCSVNHNHRRLCARPYSWKKDDRSSLPLYRSRTAYYDILKVSPNATQSQIKTAYYKQSFIFHPDKNAGSDEATQRFAEISEAYSVLGSKWLRRRYDSGIFSPGDLTSTGREPQTPTARPSGPQQQQHRARSHTSTAAGGKVHFNFDEFYRGHYGEQLRREQEARRRAEVVRKMKMEEYKKMVQKNMKVTVVMLLTLAGVIVLTESGPS